jgi:hypothetical protein
MKTNFKRTLVLERELPARDLPAGWFRISHSVVDDVTDRRHLTGQWFKLKTANVTIFRILRFDAGLRGVRNGNEGSIAIDYDGWLKLCDYPDNIDNQKVEIEISKVPKWGILFCHINHPDITYRFAAKLSILSFVLGVIGVILGVISVL